MSNRFNNNNYEYLNRNTVNKGNILTNLHTNENEIENLKKEYKKKLLENYAKECKIKQDKKRKDKLNEINSEKLRLENLLSKEKLIEEKNILLNNQRKQKLFNEYKNNILTNKHYNNNNNNNNNNNVSIKEHNFLIDSNNIDEEKYKKNRDCIIIKDNRYYEKNYNTFDKVNNFSIDSSINKDYKEHSNNKLLNCNNNTKNTNSNNNNSNNNNDYINSTTNTNRSIDIDNKKDPLLKIIEEKKAKKLKDQLICKQILDNQIKNNNIWADNFINNYGNKHIFNNCRLKSPANPCYWSNDNKTIENRLRLNKNDNLNIKPCKIILFYFN